MVQLRSLLLIASIALLSCAQRGSGTGSDGGPGAPDADNTSFPDATPGTPDAASRCGDGTIAATESCDDANTINSDGCTDTCQLEPGWACPTTGQPCIQTVVCGDGAISVGESCDDRNTRNNDGCSGTCATEAGWVCSAAGVACEPALCGDGIAVGVEDCDDGNAVAGDGCSGRCLVEDGFACTAGMPCRATVCGDGIREGTEQCDELNDDLGDGCNVFCQAEPRCTNGVCTATCGDGIRLPNESCDDGNTRDNDGCSAACMLEPGYACNDQPPSAASTVQVPIVYRDFRGKDLVNGHPDFEGSTGTDRGIVAAMLDAVGKPVYASATTTPTTNGASAFNQWYRKVDGVNLSVIDKLSLALQTDGSYVFDNSNFFPIDAKGWVAAGTEPTRTGGHNFNFTSELRYWFVYAGGEVLSFRGDDDVWVFINRKLAIDIGGVHGAQGDSITLDNTAAGNLNLTVGGIYEVVVLQAERHVTQSNYKLTLKGFNAPKTSCVSVCGDAVVTPNEACDDGTNNGMYGGCQPGCRARAARCGDGVTNAGFEQCDDGVNASTYGGCATGCTLAPRCGDGITQPAFGEECDGSAGCSSTCKQGVE
jgi:fibro-slime domain-containing protein